MVVRGSAQRPLPVLIVGACRDNRERWDKKQMMGKKKKKHSLLVNQRTAHLTAAHAAPQLVRIQFSGPRYQF